MRGFIGFVGFMGFTGLGSVGLQLVLFVFYEFSVGLEVFKEGSRGVQGSAEGQWFKMFFRSSVLLEFLWDSPGFKGLKVSAGLDGVNEGLQKRIGSMVFRKFTGQIRF